jgi:hypothetical protein
MPRPRAPRPPFLAHLLAGLALGLAWVVGLERLTPSLGLARTTAPAED